VGGLSLKLLLPIISKSPEMEIMPLYCLAGHSFVPLQPKKCWEPQKAVFVKLFSLYYSITERALKLIREAMNTPQYFTTRCF
jgi:hypothetical protein